MLNLKGRSGALWSKNDQAIEELINDSNYEIFEDGRIYSHYSGRLVGRSSKKKGRCTYVYLRTKKDGPALAVHRIIYRKFRGPLEGDLVIRHLDDNGLNNHVDNLAIGTQSENNKDRFKTKPPVAGHRKITPAIAEEIRTLHSSGLSYRQIIEVTRHKYGFGSKSSISYIINHKTWNKDTHLAPTPIESTYNQKHSLGEVSPLVKSA